MRQSHTEIWTHLVISTKGYLPFFNSEITPVIKSTIEDELNLTSDQCTYCIMPDHIHLLLKLPHDKTLNDLVDHIKTEIRNRLRLNFSEAGDFEWEKEYHAHSVSLNRLSVEKYIIERQEIKHKDMTLEEELKFFGM